MKFNFPYPNEQIAILLEIKRLISYPYKFFESSFAETIKILMDIFLVLEKNSNNIEMAMVEIELYLKKANFRNNFTEETLRSLLEKSKTSVPYDMRIRMIVLGEKSTGKTSITSHFYDNIANTKSKEAVGLPCEPNIMMINGKEVLLALKEYNQRDAPVNGHAPVLLRIPAIFCGVFDLTNKTSLDKLQSWIDFYHGLSHHTDDISKSKKNLVGIDISESNKEFVKNHLSDFPLLILGNKSDLKHQRAISQDEIDEFLERNRWKYPNLFYYEVSAKNGNNLKKAFSDFLSYIVKTIYDVKQENQKVDIGSLIDTAYNNNNLAYHVNYKNKRQTLYKALKETARLIEPDISSNSLGNAKALSFYRLYRTLLYSSQPNMLHAIRSWENSSVMYFEEMKFKTLLATHQNFFGTGEPDSVKALNDIKDFVSNNRIK